MRERRNNPYVVLPVMKALKVLTFVAERGHDLSLTSITRELDIPKTTMFRYLQTLTEAGFLQYDAARDRYSVGVRFRKLAETDAGLHNLRRVARPLMQDLVSEFNETVNLAVQVDGYIVYVDILEARNSLRIQARVGDRHRIHSTALGKAILAALPESQRQALLSRPLNPVTSRTIVERSSIERQLKQVSRLGYATERAENDEDAMCVGAAIIDASRYPIAAISLSAPTKRMPRDLISRAGLRLKEAAQLISIELGAEPIQ